MSILEKEKYPDFEKCVLYVDGVDADGNTFTEEIKGQNAWSGNIGEEVHILKYSAKQDGEYRLRIASEDLVKNVGDKYEYGFTVDSKKPEVTIKFDNNDVRNEKYYNKQRIATITVIDSSFDKDKIKLDIHEEFGKAKEGAWKNEGKTHTKTVTFAEDGIYSMKFSCKDKGNIDSGETVIDEFVIDQTEPKIEVGFDNSIPKNEFYYNKARSASIDIKELSFDDKLVKIASMPLEGVSTLPKVAAFSSEGDANKSKLSFTEDGVYGFTIECTDLAGNVSKVYVSDKFVIDTTKPTVSFDGIENYSANNGTVAPVLKCVEKNVDENLTKVTIKGANRGEVSQGSNVSHTDEGYQIAFTDFAHTKEMDDLYSVEVTVMDKAGNEVSDKIVFSVNRFGSVFVLNEAAKELNEQFYTTEAKELSITEINVDNIVKKDVTVACDGDYSELKSGKNLKIAKEGTDETWKRYTYTIPASAFDRDGVYAIGVSTVDRATNVQDSRTRDAAIDFALDRTKPSIVTPDLKSGAVYEGKSHKVNMNVTDNMGVKTVRILSDETELENYDDKDLTKTAGNVSFTLKADEKPHDIHVISTDVAGNTNEVVYESIFVGSKKNAAVSTKGGETATTTATATNIAGGKVALGGSIINSEDNTVNSNYLYYILAVVLTIAAGAGAGLFVVKKKKDKTKE